MPQWVILCRGCGSTTLRTFANVEERDAWLEDQNQQASAGEVCGPLVVVPSVSAFQIKGYAASNGYSKKE